MDPTPENLQHLSNFLGQTLSPDAAARKQAEAQLTGAKAQAGYPLLLLRLVCSGSVPEQIRLQGAIQFKNLVLQVLFRHSGLFQSVLELRNPIFQ